MTKNSLKTLNASIVLQSAMFAGKVGQQEEKKKTTKDTFYRNIFYQHLFKGSHNFIITLDNRKLKKKKEQQLSFLFLYAVHFFFSTIS